MQTSDRGDQAAVEHAARPQQRRELLPAARELLEIDDEQQRLGADQRRDDHPDAEVEHLVGVESRLPRAPRRHPEAEQIGGGQQHAVGVDGDRARAQTGLDARRPSPRRSRIISTTPIVMAASATLNAQKCQPLPRGVDDSRARIRPWRGRSDCRWRRPECTRRRGAPADRSVGTDAAYQATPASASVATSVSTSGLAREVHRVEHPERRAGVVHPRQAQQPGITSMLSCSSSALRTSAFVTWSRIDDDEHDGQLEAARTAGHGRDAQRLTGSASASTQRSHRPLNASPALTVGTYRQQRSHLMPSARSTCTLRSGGLRPLGARRCRRPGPATRRTASADRRGTPRATGQRARGGQPHARRQDDVITFSCRFSSSATFT